MSVRMTTGAAVRLLVGVLAGVVAGVAGSWSPLGPLLVTGAVAVGGIWTVVGGVPAYWVAALVHYRHDPAPGWAQGPCGMDCIGYNYWPPRDLAVVIFALGAGMVFAMIGRYVAAHGRVRELRAAAAQPPLHGVPSRTVAPPE
jgi:hypothetical protein